MNVKEIMTPDVVTCSPNDTLIHVAQKMQSMNVGSCPVVAQGNLVGIVTDRDITVRAISKGYDPANTYVNEIMTKDPIFGSPNMSVEDACGLMQDNQIRRLPIVDNNKLVGIVTLADLAIDLEEDALLAETLEKVSMPAQW